MTGSRPEGVQTRALALPEEGALGRLAQIARASLLANVVELEGRCYLSAGANQFRSLWTRDFAHAAGGLIAIGRADVVRDHLDLLIRHLHPDSQLLPRGLDSMNPKLRVAYASFARAPLPRLRPRSPALPIGLPLKAEYRDQHGQFAIDGNALAVLAALSYARATGDEAWLERSLPALGQVLAGYTQHLRAGLVWQPPYSDWQDSVSRIGHACYTNLLVHLAARDLAEHAPVPGLLLDPLRERLEGTFRAEGGLYRSLAKREQVSLDANLLALDHGLLGEADARELYERLRACPLWRRQEIPGFNTTPDYPASWRNPGVLLAGLGHYHDRIPWTWLSGLSAKVALGRGEPSEARRILEVLSARAERDGHVVEIFAAQPPHDPFRSLLYRSEAPFSWGAARILEALAAWEARAAT